MPIASNNAINVVRGVLIASSSSSVAIDTQPKSKSASRIGCAWRSANLVFRIVVSIDSSNPIADLILYFLW